MFSKHFRKNQHFSETGFRYRGIASSRLEHLTDAVFAFAITLLVIASEVPKTYVELQVSMYGFLGFIACILLIFGLWGNHSTFFLRYGMQDDRTRTLNFLFLFVLLFYIYPLKYLFSYLGSIIFIKVMYELGGSSEVLLLAASKVKDSKLTVDQWQDLMVRFGLGLMLMYSILGLMYVNAFKNRKDLELNKREVFETKGSIMAYGYLLLVSGSSMLFVGMMGGEFAGIGGFFYLTIPPVLAIMNKSRNKRMDRLYPLKEERATVESRKEEVKKDKVQKITTPKPKKKPPRTPKKTSKPRPQKKKSPKSDDKNQPIN